MQAELMNHPVRLSSRLTKTSKILIVLLGMPISSVVAFQMQFSFLGILISLLMLVGCASFSFLTVDVYSNAESIKLEGLFGKEVIIKRTDILKVHRIRSTKYDYYFFKTISHKFLVIAPISGPGKEELKKFTSPSPTNS